MSTSESPSHSSLVHHVSVGTNRMAEACAFYDAVLACIGARRVMDYPQAVGYGKEFAEFWVHPPHNGQAASAGNGVHFGFTATSREQVDAFYREALAQGGQSEGEPGPRPLYGDAYYGCFVRDLDGNKIEANFWSTPLAG